MSKKTATITSAEDEARLGEWCQVRDGVIHAAIWSPDVGGYLTTYTTAPDRKGYETMTCAMQSWMPIGDLVSWDDRLVLAKKLKNVKICKYCAAD